MLRLIDVLVEANLAHLEGPLSAAGITLDSLDGERPAQLAALKAGGISKLVERQALVGAIAKARRRLGGTSDSSISVVQLAAGLHVRVFSISDIHVDHPSNLAWIKSMLPERADGCFDVCLCPGDVSDKLPLLREVLRTLKERFSEVVFTAGNHDLWVDYSKSTAVLTSDNGKVGPDGDAPIVDSLQVPAAGTPLGSWRLGEVHLVARRSGLTTAGAPVLQKLEAIQRECAALGVRTQPLWLAPAADDASSGAAQDVVIVPLASWYHSSWDEEPALEGDPSLADFEASWSDFHRTRWPAWLEAAGGGAVGAGRAPTDGGLALARHFASLNAASLRALAERLPPRLPASSRRPRKRIDRHETYARLSERAREYAAGTPSAGRPQWTAVDPKTFFRAREAVDPAARPAHENSTVAALSAGAAGRRRPPFVLSLSHFVPRQELLPEKRLLTQSQLHKVSGSTPLREQLRELAPDLHVYGHTHLNMDLILEDGVRYVQWALGTPREQQAQTRQVSYGLIRLYDGSEGGESPVHWTHWGRHYETYARDTSLTDLAPWAERFRPAFQVSAGAPKPPGPKAKLAAAAAAAPSPAAPQPKLSWGREQQAQDAHLDPGARVPGGVPVPQ